MAAKHLLILFVVLLLCSDIKGIYDEETLKNTLEPKIQKREETKQTPPVQQSKNETQNLVKSSNISTLLLNKADLLAVEKPKVILSPVNCNQASLSVNKTKVLQPQQTETKVVQPILPAPSKSPKPVIYEENKTKTVTHGGHKAATVIQDEHKKATVSHGEPHHNHTTSLYYDENTDYYHDHDIYGCMDPEHPHLRDSNHHHQEILIYEEGGNMKKKSADHPAVLTTHYEKGSNKTQVSTIKDANNQHMAHMDETHNPEAHSDIHLAHHTGILDHDNIERTDVSHNPNIILHPDYDHYACHTPDKIACQVINEKENKTDSDENVVIVNHNINEVIERYKHPNCINQNTFTGSNYGVPQEYYPNNFDGQSYPNFQQLNPGFNDQSNTEYQWKFPLKTTGQIEYYPAIESYQVTDVPHKEYSVNVNYKQNPYKPDCKPDTNYNLHPFKYPFEDQLQDIVPSPNQAWNCNKNSNYNNYNGNVNSYYNNNRNLNNNFYKSSNGNYYNNKNVNYNYPYSSKETIEINPQKLLNNKAASQAEFNNQRLNFKYNINPPKRYSYTEVVVPNRYMDKIWRNWRRTEVIVKSKNNTVPFQIELNRGNSCGNSINWIPLSNYNQGKPLISFNGCYRNQNMPFLRYTN